jgi:transcriptional regulator with XRE-family HTH domain
MDIFSKRLKELRKSLGITQIVVAEKIGMSGRRFNDLETGKSSPSAETLIALAEYFNCSADYLLGNTDNPSRYTLDNSLMHAESDSMPEYLTPFERGFIELLRKVKGDKQQALLDMFDDKPDSHKSE